MAKSTPSAPKTLLTQQRRTQIVELVKREGMMRVGPLAAHFGVSEVTIRSDLAALDQEGLLNRDHGGAVARENGHFVSSLLRVDERATLNHARKRRIGSAAALRVSPGDTIIIDAGTTAVELARAVKAISPLTVVTNAMNVAIELHDARDIRLILLGGAFNQESASTVGPLAAQNLADLSVQKLFLGAQAMDETQGLSDSTMEIAQVKRAMIRAAREVILLTDSSKWGQVGFSRVAPLSELDVIITDTDLPAAAREALTQAGVEIVTA